MEILARPIVSLRRAALAGMEERGQVLGVDLWQVPRQDSARNTYALEHGPAQSREINWASSTSDMKELDNFWNLNTCACEGV
jgi:hypothetical protein